MRLLGKRRSSDSPVHVIALAIPCIIELLARPGPAHQGDCAEPLSKRA